VPLHDRHLIPGMLQGHVSERDRREDAPATGRKVQDSGFTVLDTESRVSVTVASTLLQQGARFHGPDFFSVCTNDWRCRVEDAEESRGWEGHDFVT
jgi:hypothetical protein